MSKAFGPKGVRARLIASSQLPASGPAPPRSKDGGAAGWNAAVPPNEGTMGMRIKAGLLMMTTMLAACGSGEATSGAAQAQARTKSAVNLSVAGLRIGMSARDARAELERTGWKVEASPGEDWAAAVDHEIKSQRNVFPIEEPKNGVAVLNATKGDETLVAEFRPTRGGDALKLAKYAAPAAGRTPQEIGADLTKRYGKPGVSTATGGVYEASWCTGGDPCRQIWGNPHPGLEAKLDVYGKLKIALFQGGAAEQAWRTEVKRAVGGAAPAKSSF